MNKKAFTLVELMITVAVLGILAAIVVPQFQSHVQKAKEATAKSNLQILRRQIELYTAQHAGLAPGYLNNTVLPGFMFVVQMTSYTDKSGNFNGKKDPKFPYGPYLHEFPVNPFNNKSTVRIINDTKLMPATVDGSSGWIYQPKTRIIKLDYPGKDSTGTPYYDY